MTKTFKLKRTNNWTSCMTRTVVISFCYHNPDGTIKYIKSAIFSKGCHWIWIRLWNVIILLEVAIIWKYILLKQVQIQDLFRFVLKMLMILFSFGKQGKKTILIQCGYKMKKFTIERDKGWVCLTNLYKGICFFIFYNPDKTVEYHDPYPYQGEDNADTLIWKN